MDLTGREYALFSLQLSAQGSSKWWDHKQTTFSLKKTQAFAVKIFFLKKDNSLYYIDNVVIIQVQECYDLNKTCTHGKTCYLFIEFVQFLDLCSQ